MNAKARNSKGKRPDLLFVAALVLELFSRAAGLSGALLLADRVPPGRKTLSPFLTPTPGIATALFREAKLNRNLRIKRN
jgi:hypothetical protein